MLSKNRDYRTFALFVHMVGVFLRTFCEVIHIFSPFIHILEQRVVSREQQKRIAQIIPDLEPFYMS